jgi:hypothetical protein
MGIQQQQKASKRRIEFHPRTRLQATIVAVARGRALLRYPLYIAPVRGVTAKAPVRR